MVDLRQPNAPTTEGVSGVSWQPKQIVLLLTVIAAISLTLAQFVIISQMNITSPIFLDSTVGELAVWMADQATEEAPESFLGQIAAQRLPTVGEDNIEQALLTDMSRLLTLWTGGVAALVLLGALGLALSVRWHRWALLAALVGTNTLLYVIPPTPNTSLVTLVLLGVVTLGVLLLLAAQSVEKITGFVVMLALFTVAWESSKAFANLVNYNITLPAAAWEYSAYDDLDAALAGLQSGEITALLADRNALDEIMPPHPTDPDTDAATLAYPDLRHLTEVNRTRQQLGLEIEPELARRVSVATTADTAPTITDINQLQNMPLGTVAGSFVEGDFLQQDHQWVLMNFRISNDLNLPHLQSIAEALLQPARRNGPVLLLRILWGAALYTMTEALLGFVFGATLGFILGSVFAHIPMLQRSLMPYVIASQTIPIIALAPMIVIWLRDTHPILPVAVISSYLTFFPVTINTLRGLQSPDRLSLDLVHSYAASPWQTMWKLRFPAALPYIFTALKVSATASVVGAIIGELPSGVRNGLGRAILNFSSDYSLISTPKLWGAIFIAAITGIVFYVAVLLVESVVLRQQLDA